MKTLKLQVGKTYRSREGEEVKIVKMGNMGWDYWNGNNGEWYYEGGKWSHVTEEHPKDLIEEVTATRYTFAIPNGVTKLIVEQVSNRIVVEMVPDIKEPKSGDIMINNRGSIYIFKRAIDDHRHEVYAWLGKDGGIENLLFTGCCFSGRPATSEEAKLLFDALKKEGKRWNPKTMEVEEITEFEHIREWAKEYLSGCYYNHERIAEIIEAYLKYREGEK